MRFSRDRRRKATVLPYRNEKHSFTVLWHTVIHRVYAINSNAVATPMEIITYQILHKGLVGRPH